MNLTDKIVLVVGGATGIGCATAALCVERGARVIIADLNEAAGSETAAQLGVTFFPVDVSKEESVRDLFARVEAQFGRLDVLLHTAGVLKGAFVPLEEFSIDTWRAVLDINTTGSFLCAKWAAPLMKKNGSGVIVLVSSGAALGGSSSFAYGTSKGGMNTLGLLLANALGRDGIRVNVVMPGNIDTAMKRSVIAADIERKGQGQDLEKAVADSNLGSPDGVARILAWLASDEADYVRGIISTR